MTVTLPHVRAVRFFLYCMATLCSLVLAGCGGSSGGSGTVGLPSATALYSTAPAAVVVAMGTPVSFTAGGGTPTYRVTSSNQAVATAAVNGASFTVTAVGGGAATITLTDAAGATLSLAVTVNGNVVNPPPATALFTSAPAVLTVGVGSGATYAIGGGVPAYTVSSSNTGVAQVAINGKLFAITGVAAGAAQINVVDAAGTAVTLSVTVGGGATLPPTPLFTSAPASVTVAPGAAASFTIGGGVAPYAVSSSNSGVARVGVNGNSFAITGVAAGAAQITIVDGAGAAVTLAATVGNGGPALPLFTTAASTITIASGSTGNYSIGGGSGSYLASSSNSAVASVSISGSSLTIVAQGAGTARVQVFDGAGAVIGIDVTVTQASLSAVQVIPSEADGNVGDSLRFIVSGGAPVYGVTVNNPGIASVSPALVQSSGGSFSVQLLNVGATVITIVDGRGQSTTVPIQVSQLTTQLRLAPSAWTIGENANAVLGLSIYGGVAPYRTFTSDETLSSVSISGASVQVGLGTRLSRCINPVTSEGTYIPNGTFDVTVTVLDSLGASASSVMTIKDNGAGLNAACP